MANKRESGYITTMVCVTCGAEQFFDEAVPVSLTCPKCHSTVFRQFTTPTSPDEVVLAELEDKTRSIRYGDASPGTAPDDVRELES